MSRSRKFNSEMLPAPSSAMHQQLAEFEQRMAYHRDHLLYDYDIRWVANSHIPWTVSLPAARGTRREELRTVKAWGAVIHMNSLCRKHEVPMLPTMEGWMSTEIHVPHDTVITAWISFDTPVRVNRRSPGIGYQGHWESDGRVSGACGVLLSYLSLSESSLSERGGSRLAIAYGSLYALG